MRHSSAAILATALAMLMAAPVRAATAISTEAFLGRYFGVNLHLSNCCGGRYEDTERVIADIRYIGARRLRDWATARRGVFERWQHVARETSTEFSASIPSSSPKDQRIALGVIRQWLAEAPGLITTIEGGNEPDMPYAVALGATLEDTAKLQHEVYAAGKGAGVLVAQMSVGFGWKPPLYEGNYKSFGKPPADLGNAHVYLQHHMTPSALLSRAGELAAYSVNGKPISVTEFGAFKTLRLPTTTINAFMHIAPFAAAVLKQDSLYVYALYDDLSGVSGFFNEDGKPRDFAHYWHHTAQLLSDTAGKELPARDVPVTFSSDQLPKSAAKRANHLVMHKSDKSVWAAVVFEHLTTAANHEEVITFSEVQPHITIIDARDARILARHTKLRAVTLSLPPNQLLFVVASRTQYAEQSDQPKNDERRSDKKKIENQFGVGAGEGQ